MSNKILDTFHGLSTTCPFVQIEKSQGEIYRLRAKLESTQTENENLHDECEKMQRALNQSYADRDKIGADMDKIRDDLERSQVENLSTFCPHLSTIVQFFLASNPLANSKSRRRRRKRHSKKLNRTSTECKRNSNEIRTISAG